MLIINHLSAKYLNRLLCVLVFSVFIIGTTLSTFAAPLTDSEEKALNEYVNWVASQCSPDTSTTVAPTSANPSTPTNLHYISIGNIPAGGKDVGASIFGGTYINGSFGPTNDVQGGPQPHDDNGQGNGGGSPAGHSAYAELSVSPGSQDFSAMGNLPEHTKLAITFKGKTVIAEKLDVGAGGSSVNGKPRVIDLWWETAKLLNFTTGTDVVNIRAVDASTPATPVDAQPTDTTTATTPQCACTSSTTLVGTDDKSKIWNYFISKGLNDIQTAAVMGNFQQESSFNPLEIQNGGNSKNPADAGSGGWGLAQWTPGTKALDEAQKYHITGPIYELATQLDLIWAEMSGSSPTGVSDMVSHLKTLNDLSSATSYFTTAFEGPSIVGPRLTYAQQILSQFSHGSTGSTGGGSSPGTGGCAPSSSSSSGYKNPLRDIQGLFARRIDQGVDYGGHGPIYAIGNGTVDTVFPIGSSASGWPGGGWVSYTLTDGPAKGKIVYFAESCDPKVTHGQTVTSSTVICQMSGDSSPWIETGWAASEASGDTQPLAQQYGGNGSTVTTVGINFNDLLKSLGAPSGLFQGSTIGNPLPSDFPTWK